MEKSNNTEPEYIRAKRGDREQSFTRETWDMLGPKKQGWEEIVEEPEELKVKEPTAEEIKKIEDDLQADKDKEEQYKELLAKQKEEDEAKKNLEPKSGIEKALTARQETEELYKKTFNVESAPKVSAKELQKLIDAENNKPSEGTGSDAPTPEELLNKISKEA